MITVNRYQNGTYFLSPTNNQITFGQGMTIKVASVNNQQNGVYGAPGPTWTIVNDGYIAAMRALYLKGPATVTNSGTLISTQFAAVYLDAGGTFINNASGTVTGHGGGVYVAGGSGAVTNAGSIVGDIHLHDGGTVTNDPTGTISSGDVPGAQMGVELVAGGTVYNFGSLMGDYFGVQFDKGGTLINEHDGGGTLYGALYGAALGFPAAGKKGGLGGTVINDAGATISGKAGVVAQGAAAFVTNSGSIAGTSDSTQTVISTTFMLGDGVWLDHGGTVTNNAGAIISGQRYGVELKDAGTITDAGTISGVKDAVKFTGSGRHTLNLETGAKLIGTVDGSTASEATNVLSLSGKGTTNADFSHFQTLTLHKDASWTFSGTSSIGATTVGAGGRLTVAGSLTTAMTLDAKSVATIDGSLTGSVSFDGAAELALFNPVIGAVSGLGVGDRIDFLSAFYEPGDKVKIAGQELEIVNSEIGVIETLKLGGSYLKSEFTVGHDSAGHLLVSFVAPSAQSAGGEGDAERMAMLIRGDDLARASFSTSHTPQGGLGLGVEDAGWRLAASGGMT